MDLKRIFLGYAFFMLGVCLTCYQYYHLIDHGVISPWHRQFALIVINTLAVYIGWLLTYPWDNRDLNDEEREAQKVHSQRLMWVSLFFCFVTMLGITVAIIRDDRGSHIPPRAVVPEVVDNSPDLLGRRQSVPVETAQSVQGSGTFPWKRYAIATLYMIGYGVLGVGPHIVRWVLRSFFNEAASIGKSLDSDSGSQRAPKKRQFYPIESTYVLGKIRKKSKGGKSGGRASEETPPVD